MLPDLGTTLSPKPSKAETTSVRIPPSQPTRLEIDGAYPINARVLRYEGPINPVVPPDGNYRDLFVLPFRGGGLAGDGASDATFVIGHTYSGDTPGVLDNLQKAVFDEKGNLLTNTRVRLTTEVGTLTYCVKDAFIAPKGEMGTSQFWVPGTFEDKGNWLGILACFLSEDGESQTEHNIGVTARRC